MMPHVSSIVRYISFIPILLLARKVKNLYIRKYPEYVICARIHPHMYQIRRIP